MNPVFVDTSFFKAFIDPNDDFYPQAKVLWKQLIETHTPLITTNYILDETFTLIRVRCNLPRALELRHVLFTHDINMRVERVLIEDDAAAWDWFEKNWSKLSFTDCVSFAVMKRLELTDVATFDQHFAKAGFRITQP